MTMPLLLLGALACARAAHADGGEWHHRRLANDTIAAQLPMGTHVSLTDSQYDTIKIMQFVVCPFSLVGAVFVFVSYLQLKNIRTFQMRLVVMMSVADFLATLSIMLPLPQTQALCTIQGMAQEFWIASVLWSSAVAYVLHSTVVRRVQASALEAQEVYLHAFCWGVPGLFMLLPFTTEGYAHAGAWCWIGNDTTGQRALRFIGFYGWVIAGVVYSLVSYMQVVRKFVKMAEDAGQSKEDTDRMKSVFQRLQLYPLITAITWTPGLINRVTNLFIDENTAHSDGRFALLIAHTLFVALSGFMNATAFGVRSNAFHDMWALCDKEAGDEEETGRLSDEEGTLTPEPTNKP